MKTAVFFLSLLTISSASIAENEIGFSLGLSNGYYELEDSQNTSDNDLSEPSISIGAEYKISRIHGLFARIDLIDDEFESDNTNTAFEGYLLRVGYEKKIRGLPLQPWVGVGFSSLIGTASDRYTISDSGFLDEVFPDEDISSFGGFASIRKKHDFDFGSIVYGANYDIALSEGLSGLGFNLSYVYSFGK